MDSVRAKRDAEAKRYRLQVRLSLVAKKARFDGATELVAEAKSLRGIVNAVQVGDDEVKTQAGQRRLAELEPMVLDIQAQAGVEEHGLPMFPKWLKFALWTSPVVFFLMILAAVVGLRSRKKEVDAEGLAALERSSLAKDGS